MARLTLTFLALLAATAARGEHARPPVPHTPEPPAARMPLGDREPDPLAAEITRFQQWSDVAQDYTRLSLGYWVWADERRALEQDRAAWPARVKLAARHYSAWSALMIALDPECSESWRRGQLNCLCGLIGQEAFDKGWMPVPRPCDRWEADP